MIRLGQSSQDCGVGVRLKINLPYISNSNFKPVQKCHLLGITSYGPNLAWVLGAHRISSRISMPEGSISLQDHVSIRQIEVSHRPKPSMWISEMVLRQCFDAQVPQNLSNGLLKSRYSRDTTLSNGQGGRTGQLGFGLFSVPIISCSLSNRIPGSKEICHLLTSCEGDIVRNFYQSPNQAKSPSLVVAGTGAEECRGFSLCPSGDGFCDKHPAYSTRFYFRCKPVLTPQCVRALPRTSRPAPVFQTGGVYVVIQLANRATSFHRVTS